MVAGIRRLPVIDTRPLFAPDRHALAELLGTLTPQQWQAPTVCDGWSVHDVALHLLWVDLSNISRRRDQYFGREQHDPGDLSDMEDLVAFINDLNNSWVRTARRVSPRLLIDLLAMTGQEFSNYLNAVDIEALGDSVGWAGSDPAPIWLDVGREYTERWVHQQQIRDAVGIPGQTERRFLHPVLATFAMALPYALRDVEAEPGSTAMLTINGGGGGSWCAERTPGRWELVPEIGGTPTGSLVLDETTAWKLFTKGLDADAGHIEELGDPAISRAIRAMVTILA